MRHWIGICAALAVLFAAGAADAQNTLRVGACTKTVTTGISAPYAVANKYGWFGDFKVEIVALAGSADCVKYVGTGEIRYALSSVEPLGVLRPQGIKAKVFYTAFQGYIFGIDVPVESPIKTLQDLEGKKIGVTSMASGGALVARATVASLGFENSTPIIAIGEGGQAIALLRSGQVDALSFFDTQYALIANAGMPLRALKNPAFEHFPSNGFIALEDTLAKNRAEAVALARGYAMGTVFAMANPAATVRIIWEEFPNLKTTGKDDATAFSDDVSVLRARFVDWSLASGGVKRWGESPLAHYQAYLDFLLKWGVLTEPVKAADIVTNGLIADINAFDAGAVLAQAKAAQP